MTYIILTEDIPSCYNTVKGSIYELVNWGEGSFGFLVDNAMFVAKKYKVYNTMREAKDESERILAKK
ncbi:hypothetical protein LCGC14_1266200 [marine sediment metagenome]|uniref:Uncharacterized protein n=1 Tax=marine sediment metagenome TaxID=412755 RepID=A0A0F9NG42_9ZZZZ